MTPDQITQIRDPEERAHQAEAALERLPLVAGELARIRSRAFRELHATGLSYAAIGELFGISRQAAARVAKGR